jgi:NAD(P)-dependent dehydrogenase (short-subunit alcohol dehydrogenase family)
MTKPPPPQFEARDPRTAYPAPPFPSQQQDGNGLTARMDPQPDHGESSYVGFGRMKGRRALITGGDSGIGRAVAIAFAREGASVMVNCLHDENDDAKSTLALLKEGGAPAWLNGGDVSDEDYCKRLIVAAQDVMGGIDILVNNAGMQITQKSIQDITTEQFDQTYRTNVYASFWLCKAALPRMKPGSVIINVTSVQGYDPSENLLDYASSKFALRGFTRALAKQVANQGIRVNAVAPGPFWTPLQPSGGQTDEKVQHFGENSLFGRPGQPAEIAATFVFLATQESGYMTGETIGVTGGHPIA